MKIPRREYYTLEEIRAAKAHWNLIMRSPLPKNDLEEAEENATLTRLSIILGV